MAISHLSCRFARVETFRGNVRACVVDRCGVDISALLSSVLIFTFLHSLASDDVSYGRCWWWSWDSLIQTLCLSLKLLHLLLSLLNLLALLQLFPLFNAIWMPTMSVLSLSCCCCCWRKLSLPLSLINDDTSQFDNALLSSGRLIDAIVVMVCDDVGDGCPKYPMHVDDVVASSDELQGFWSLSMGISTCTLLCCLWNWRGGLCEGVELMEKCCKKWVIVTSIGCQC